MRNLIILVLAALPAFATDYTSAAAGPCTTNTNWTPNGVPGNGDRIIIGHAMTSCGITIGRASTNDSAGTGTVSSGGSTALVGVGTAFLTELAPGMTIYTPGGAFPVPIASVQSDTNATLAQNLNTYGSKTFTIRDYAVYLKTGGSLTVQPGGTLTLHGDYNSAGRTTTITDANMVFDSATQHYRYFGLNGASIQALAGSARASISATGAYGSMNDGGGGNSIIMNNVDFSNLGDATHYGVDVGVTSGNSFKFLGNTFTNVGQLGSTAVNIGATADLVFTRNRVISVPAGVPKTYQWLNLGSNAATTGQRTITNNVIALSDAALLSSFNTFVGYTVTGNIFNVFTGAAASGTATFRDNIIYIRAPLQFTTGTSFIGCGGDSVVNNYILNDQGAGQTSPMGVMSSDTCGVSGLHSLTGNIVDFVATPTAAFGMMEASGAPSVDGTYKWDHNVFLPNAQGYGPVYVTWRGTSRTTGIHDFNTGVTSRVGNGGGYNGGMFAAGGQYTGFLHMWASVKNNLAWARTSTYPGTGTGNLLGGYDAGSTPATDLVDNTGVANNAYYNANSGQMCNGSGTGCLTVLGWGGFRNATPLASFPGDLNLGTGTDERTQGPRLADTTRNMATFDTAYLGNTAPAWTDDAGVGHNYVVGDTVSAATSTFYGNATINYRCIKAHTSLAGNATNGKPGSAGTLGTTAPPSGYRTNWEFASVRRIEDAIISGATITDGAIGCNGCTYTQALTAWVKRGFTPQAPALWCGATDGTSVGAVNFCTKAKAMVGAIAF